MNKRQKKTKNYYTVEQEEGVVLFLKAKTVEEKEIIYREYLQKAIDKLIENIIRTYKLYRVGYTYEQVHADTLSFLITKFDKFKPSKGKKSYSYFGTVCKNYLIGEIKKDDKRKKNTLDMEGVGDDILVREDMVYNIDQDDVNYGELIELLIFKLKEEVDTKDLSENEFKVGHSLIKILEDWRVLFDVKDDRNSKKFNKNLILLYLRNMTGLTTKEIRKAMRNFKTIYYVFKADYLDE